MSHNAAVLLSQIHSEPLAHLLASVHKHTSTLGGTITDVPLSLAGGDVVEIQGPPASGKTHLLYLLLLDCLAPTVAIQQSKAAFVFDTDRTFDIKRFQELLLARTQKIHPLDTSLHQETVAKFLENLHIFRPSSSAQLAATIFNLPRYHSSFLPKAEIGLVAIDSMSSFYWHDRFIMEQARSNHPSTESGRTNTIEHISTALQLFRLSHNPIICVTNWGLIAASNRVFPEPILYRQHLPTFPAPFDNHQSYHQDPPFNTPTHVDNEWKSRATFTITHHITLGIPLVNEPGVQIAGLIRTSGNPRLGRFTVTL